MSREKAIIIFHRKSNGAALDLEVPLDITANELVFALNSALNLNINTADIKNCYFSAENPIVLLRGNKTLAEFGVRNGTVINF